MEIQERTFCVLIDKEKGIESTKFVKVIGTGGTNPEEPPILVKDASGDIVRCNEDQLIPLVENCESVQEAWQKHQPEIIKNLAIMIHDLQKQISRLRSDSDSSTQALIKTQEKIRDHILSPHGKGHL